MNRAWRFLRYDAAGAELRDFDDTAWAGIHLPHSFDLPYFRTPEFYVGIGWYRRNLHVDKNESHYALEFAGAFQVAEVYVNDVHVGSHAGGYTGFCFDITQALRDGDNLIAVRVSNEWNPRVAPRAGEHIFSGGLYRDVHLVTTDALHIAWNGAWITTPHVSRDQALVRGTIEVTNALRQQRNATLTMRLMSPDGQAVASCAHHIALAAGETLTTTLPHCVIDRPLLWHPDHPHLYAAQCTLEEAGNVIDSLTIPVGLRWFEWTADRGFFLNDEHLYLLGANAHQDHAGWGIAISQSACERDVRLIKQAGFNFVRGAHYPHHPAFSEACDRLGLLFWSENAFWGKGGFGPEGYWNASAYPVNSEDFEAFESNCLMQLHEMIRIHRNHPSIIAWGMTNEAFFTYHLDRAKALMHKLVALSRTLDPTRPAAIGGAQRGDVDLIGDIAGYNGDGARLFLDPGIPNLVSEYGAISKPPDAFDPFFHELQQETLAWRSGQAIWCGFDYGTIAGRQGLKGIVDHARVPKRSWYWYRQQYLNEPAPPPTTDLPATHLSIETDRALIRGTNAIEDAQVVITALDANGQRTRNTPPITLSILSGPGEFPTGRTIRFSRDADPQITEGKAAIAFRSYEGGTTQIRAVAPGMTDATMQIQTIGEPAFDPATTLLVDNRPYAPPSESDAAKRAMHNAVNVALNRPCRASSETADHPARLANDGDSDSHWQPTTLNAGAWWQLDLEGFYQLASVRIVFASDGNLRFNIELSTDAKIWRPGVDRSQSVRTDRLRNDVLPPGAIARFVRLTITHVPEGVVPGLAELEVQGVLSVR